MNAAGGVNKRKIVYKYLDDGYDPSKTVQVIRELVQQDQVFAVFNTLGTNNNLAVRDFLNQSGVPHVFVASGANTWGADYKKFPWTIGFIPSYILEGVVYGRYIVKNHPTLKLGVLYQDDAYGKDMVAGLKKGLAQEAKQIVSLVGYDPTGANVASQVAQIKASKANAYLIFAFGKFAVQASREAAMLGLEAEARHRQRSSPPRRTSWASATSPAGKAINKGAISIAVLKDPTDPKWAKDPGLAAARKILKKQIPSANLKDGYYYAGMASAMSHGQRPQAGGAEPHARLADQGGALAEPAEASAADPRHRGEDVADRRLPDRAGGAPALGQRQGLGHRPLVALRPAADREELDAPSARPPECMRIARDGHRSTCRSASELLTAATVLATASLRLPTAIDAVLAAYLHLLRLGHRASPSRCRPFKG